MKAISLLLSEKNSKKGISCKFLTDFEGNKRKNSKS